jgi:serine/threonine-protein kinase RsbW
MWDWLTRRWRKTETIPATEASVPLPRASTGARAPSTSAGSTSTGSTIAVAFDSTANSWLFRVPRTREAISGFCAFVEKRLPVDYVDLDTLRAFQVAFDEILTNVLSHASAESAHEPVDVLLRRTGTEVSATIRYRAAEYDPTVRSAPDTDASIADRPIGGLGVHLVRTMMDAFTHRYAQGCNELVLTRLLGPRNV